MFQISGTGNGLVKRVQNLPHIFLHSASFSRKKMHLSVLGKKGFSQASVVPCQLQIAQVKIPVFSYLLPVHNRDEVVSFLGPLSCRKYAGFFSPTKDIYPLDNKVTLFCLLLLLVIVLSQNFPELFVANKQILLHQ